MRNRRLSVGVGLVLTSGWGLGCQPIPKGFDSPEPAARIEAAVEAAGAGDTGSIPDLIMLLDSDDPATRLIAITSLRRLTGETLGYDYTADVEAREPAVVRWVEWYNENADGVVAGAGVSGGGDR